jgi:uncharacterized protein
MRITNLCSLSIVLGLTGLEAAAVPSAAMSAAIPTLNVTSVAATAYPNNLPEVRMANAEPVTLPNPSAAFCIENGGKYEIRQAADGSQSSVCILPDGSEVDAWQFFREKNKAK